MRTGCLVAWYPRQPAVQVVNQTELLSHLISSHLLSISSPSHLLVVLVGTVACSHCMPMTHDARMLLMLDMQFHSHNEGVFSGVVWLLEDYNNPHSTVCIQ